MVGCQRHVLPERKDRRSFLRNRYAVGSERDLLSGLGRDLRLNVELGAAIGAYVQVVDTLDRPVQLLPGTGPSK